MLIFRTVSSSIQSGKPHRWFCQNKMAQLLMIILLVWTIHLTDANVDVKYESMASTLQTFTSQTCSMWSCRSRLTAFVACTKEAACRAVWSYRTDDDQLQCGVCTCMSKPELRTETTHLEPGLHIKVQSKFDTGMYVYIILMTASLQ